MQLNLSESESLTESEIDLVKDLGVRHGQKNDDTYYIDSINQLELKKTYWQNFSQMIGSCSKTIDNLFLQGLNLSQTEGSV